VANSVRNTPVLPAPSEPWTSSLKLYVRRYHEGDGDLFKCDRCQKQFARNWCLKNHVTKIHEGGRRCKRSSSTAAAPGTKEVDQVAS
jgi:hypothetical protein